MFRAEPWPDVSLVAIDKASLAAQRAFLLKTYAEADAQLWQRLCNAHDRRVLDKVSDAGLDGLLAMQYREAVETLTSPACERRWAALASESPLDPRVRPAVVSALAGLLPPAVAALCGEYCSGQRAEVPDALLVLMAEAEAKRAADAAAAEGKSAPSTHAQPPLPGMLALEVQCHDSFPEYDQCLLVLGAEGQAWLLGERIVSAQDDLLELLMQFGRFEAAATASSSGSFDISLRLVSVSKGGYSKVTGMHTAFFQPTSFGPPRSEAMLDATWADSASSSSLVDQMVVSSVRPDTIGRVGSITLNKREAKNGYALPRGVPDWLRRRQPPAYSRAEFGIPRPLEERLPLCSTRCVVDSCQAAASSSFVAGRDFLPVATLMWCNVD